jgi:serine/threonine protein kinase
MADETIDSHDPPGAAGADEATTLNGGDSEAPERIGRYRILSVLGEGGMGIVYAAEQRTPVRREVALKLIKLGMDTRDVIARFETERQALAMMDHPHVAKVFDAGATETGRPYFVMELVRGQPITEYCDARNLPTRMRLELFALVCDAVQHAHMKGVIHRDLKPRNVLVCEQDGKPVPKVIDFGIAKATNQRLTEKTLYTSLGALLGTPEYMSPEQAEGSTTDVDTRSDIYSLGVTLYELLAGTLPFASESLRGASYNEIQRIIREVDPPRPSTRLSRLGDNAAEVARRRQTRVEDLTAELRSELEWIPLKAMRKERDHRYRSASELGDDVRNYLAGRPLLAAPPSTWYRTRKFLRRNRAPVGAALAFVLLLIAGIITTTWQALEAHRQRKLAEGRFNDVRQLSRRLIFELDEDVRVLAGSAPALKKMVDMSLEYLSRLSAESSDDLALMSDVARAYVRLGDIQGNPNRTNLGDVRAAESSYRKSLAIAETGLRRSRDHTQLRAAQAEAKLKLGDVAGSEGKHAEAIIIFQAVQQHFDEVASAKPGEFFDRYNAVNVVLPRMIDVQLQSGDAAGALATARRHAEAAKRLAADFPREPRAADAQGDSLNMLADTHWRSGDLAGAVTIGRQHVDHLERLLRAEPDNVVLKASLARACSRLAQFLHNSGASDGTAEATRGVALAREIYAVDYANRRSRHLLTTTLVTHASLLRAKGDFSSAAKVLEEVIDLLQQTVNEGSADRTFLTNLISVYGDLGAARSGAGDHAGSVEAHQRGIDMLSELMARDPNNAQLAAGMAFAQMNLGIALDEHGDPVAAVACLRKAVEGNQRWADRNPSDANAARTLLLSQHALADAIHNSVAKRKISAAEHLPALDESRALYSNVRQRYLELRDAKRLTAPQEKSLEEIEQRLRELDELGAAPTTQR